MNFFKFLISKRFFKHLLIAAVLAFIVIQGTFWTLDIYTNHNENYTVPDFRGMPLSEVREIIEHRNFRYEIIDSVYSDEVPKGTIVEQNPPPKFKVKENRKIFLTLNAFSDEKIAMPNLTDISLVQAKADMETFGLKIGKIKYRPYEAKNWVLKQLHNGEEIEPGTTIKKGAVIDFVLGEGLSDEEINVPNLIGLTKDIAVQKATDSYLNIGATIYDNSVKTREDSANAVIWKQSPRPVKNSEIDVGASVDVWLTIREAKALSAKYEYENLNDTTQINEEETEIE